MNRKRYILNPEMEQEDEEESKEEDL